MKNKALNTWSFIDQKLQNQVPCYLMVIAESKGSSPGRKGFKMAVSADGELTGSIGGGSMEHSLVERCKRMLAEGNQSIFLKKETHHGNAASPSGMICSGNQTVAFFPMGVDQLALVQNVLAAIHDLKSIQLQFSTKGIALMEEKVDKKNADFSSDDAAWSFTEVPGKQYEVYIVGGGHVSLALTQLLSMLDFRITVFDNRNQVNTFVENAFAHEKQIISYEEVGSYIPQGQNIMVVIMTQFHSSDALVLEQLINHNLGYLGMMGSQSKVKTIFAKLTDKGISPDLLQKVHAPIGIEIKSQTPEEIAVSIAAELIATKNGKLN